MNKKLEVVAGTDELGTPEVFQDGTCFRLLTLNKRPT